MKDFKQLFNCGSASAATVHRQAGACAGPGQYALGRQSGMGGEEPPKPRISDRMPSVGTGIARYLVPVGVSFWIRTGTGMRLVHAKVVKAQFTRQHSAGKSRFPGNACALYVVYAHLRALAMISASGIFLRKRNRQKFNSIGLFLNYITRIILIKLCFQTKNQKRTLTKKIFFPIFLKNMIK